MARRLTPSSDRWLVYAYCDSQFSALSTEVLNHVSWKHNRSGSPSATLADTMEPKVPKHGSRANPTIDPRHDSEPMHIMQYSGRQSIL